MSLDSVIVLTFLRIKCPVSTSFPSNVDLVTCFHSFSSLFAPLIVRLRNPKNYAGSKIVSWSNWQEVRRFHVASN